MVSVSRRRLEHQPTYNTMSRTGEWFVVGEGIAREVITADIQRYLGSDALVKPGLGTGEDEGRPGYWIIAYRTLTAQMIQDLKLDTTRWQQEQECQEAGCGGSSYMHKLQKVSRHPDEPLVAYQDSRTHAVRQHWGPTEKHASASGIAVNREPTAYLQQTMLQPRIQPRTLLEYGYSYPPERQPYRKPKCPISCYYSFHGLRVSSELLLSNYLSNNMTRLVGLASTEGASHHWQKEVPLSPNYVPQDVKPGQNRKLGREESPTAISKPSGRRPEWSIHHPNPSTLERTNRPDDPTRPDSPLLSYLLPEDSEVDPAEAIHIERSYSLLEVTAKTLNRSVDDLTYMCHWQVGGSKFCETSVGTELESIRSLGKGSVGEVDEVQVAGMDEIVEHFVRKRITISRQKRTADRELKAVANEVENLKKVHVHPHIVTIIGSYREETA